MSLGFTLNYDNHLLLMKSNFICECLLSLSASAALCIEEHMTWITIITMHALYCDWPKNACFYLRVYTLNRACVDTGCMLDNTKAFMNYFPSIIIDKFGFFLSTFQPQKHIIQLLSMHIMLTLSQGKGGDTSIFLFFCGYVPHGFSKVGSTDRFFLKN